MDRQGIESAATPAKSIAGTAAWHGVEGCGRAAGTRHRRGYSVNSVT